MGKSKETNLQWILLEEEDYREMTVEQLTGYRRWHKVSNHENFPDSTRSDYNIMVKKESSKVKKTLNQLANQYNKRLENFKKINPITCQIIWNIYKNQEGCVARGGYAKNELPVLSDFEFAWSYIQLCTGVLGDHFQKEFQLMFEKIIYHSKVKQLKEGIEHKGSKMIAELLVDSHKHLEDDLEFKKQLESNLDAKLISEKPGESQYLKDYTFEYKDGKQRTTMWDLREKELPLLKI